MSIELIINFDTLLLALVLTLFRTSSPRNKEHFSLKQPAANLLFDVYGNDCIVVMNKD